jgi:hypothetical protein
MKPPPKIGSLIVGYAVMGTMSPFGLRAEANNWPVVQPLRETRTFVNPGRDNADTPFLTLIKDSEGVPIYKLECHNGNYDDESEIDFSGDFHCALFAVKGDTLKSANLLAANTRDERSRDWWNRGRMRSEQLRGECLAYPEYSTVRHFRLRQMLITLRFTDIAWSASKDQQNNPLLGKFTFTVDVVPEKTAHSQTAELAAGPKPPRPCYP